MYLPNVHKIFNEMVLMEEEHCTIIIFYFIQHTAQFTVTRQPYKKQ